MRVTLLLALALTLRAVTPLPVGALLQHPAHYFDLAHHRVRFVPQGASYDIFASPDTAPLTPGTPVGQPTDPRGQSWRTPLPFPFPFAGKKWNELYINLNGSLTFAVPEAAAYPEREAWPDATVRNIASIFETRSLTGERPAILPLWSHNSADSTHISIRSTRGAFTVTWQAIRYQAVNEAYAPLGQSTFQAILAPNGSIEFRYGDVAEKDGIAGVFTGPGAPGKTLQRLDIAPVPGLAPETALRRAEVEDRGAGLRFLLTLAAPVPSKTIDGVLYYGVAVMSGGEGYVVRWSVDPAGAKSDPFCVAANPQGRTVDIDCSVRALARASGDTVELYLPKIALKNPAAFQWKASTARNEDELSTTGGLRPVSLAPMPSAFDFTRPVRSASGNIYDIFYYPFLSKSRAVTFQEIYRHAPAEDDFAIALTDFRIDDIHNHGASNTTVPPYADPREMYNSPSLQQAAGPVYMGPRFREVIHEGSRTFRHYAFAVGWAAHEMTHRWVATLRWKPANPLALLDGKWHWNPLLVTTVVTPVSPYFADPPYPEQSIMGGMTVEMLSPTAAHGVLAPWGSASSLCPLDLYSMGLVGPDEVPDTFLISGAVNHGAAEMTGGDAVPVRIADIIAANGPRVPPASAAQHRFRLEIYLLHEDARPPDPAALAQARGIESALCEYFKLATNARMTVVPSRETP